jgi:IS5 family transposase
MVELQDIVKASIEKAHEITVGNWFQNTDLELNTTVARVQGLLEVAKTAAQLDAVRDAQILASRRAMDELRATRRSAD